MESHLLVPRDERGDVAKEPCKWGCEARHGKWVHSPSLDKRTTSGGKTHMGPVDPDGPSSTPSRSRDEPPRPRRQAERGQHQALRF